MLPNTAPFVRGYDRLMAEEGTLQEQLAEIGAQLAWVRDYL
jgi:hypothetical protein